MSARLSEYDVVFLVVEDLSEHNAEKQTKKGWTHQAVVEHVRDMLETL